MQAVPGSNGSGRFGSRRCLRVSPQLRFDDAGKMIEFEVMVRPIKALQALGDEMGNRIGPQLAHLKEAAAASR